MFTPCSVRGTTWMSIEIYELKVLELGYYVLQFSAENATNNGTSQVNRIHSGTAKKIVDK